MCTDPLKDAHQITLYVGSLSPHATEAELRKLFEPFGAVHRARLIADRASGRLRGVALVVMERKGGEVAKASLGSTQFYGRILRVEEARAGELTILDD